jgi:hypothetical protein
MKLKIVPTLIIILCLILLVLTLPFPSRIDFQMDAVEITANGEISSKGSISIQGWRLHYLLREFDEMLLRKIQVFDLEFGELEGNDSPVWEYIEPFSISRFYEFDTKAGQFYDIVLGLDQDKQFCVIEAKDRYFVGSVEADANYFSILQQYLDMFRNKTLNIGS